MLKKHKKKILLGLVVALVLIQLKTIDKTNSPVVPENDFLVKYEAPKKVAELMETVCYDCHGNTTKYPWYSNIAPISWWIKGHIDHGKEKMNFSEWSSYNIAEQDSLIAKSSELIGKKWMPILAYKITHSEARLSEEQREMLMKWLDQLSVR